MVNIILCDDEVESLQRTQDEIERIKTRLPYPVEVITYTDTDYLMERINNRELENDILIIDLESHSQDSFLQKGYNQNSYQGSGDGCHSTGHGGTAHYATRDCLVVEGIAQTRLNGGVCSYIEDSCKSCQQATDDVGKHFPFLCIYTGQTNRLAVASDTENVSSGFCLI